MGHGRLRNVPKHDKDVLQTSGRGIDSLRCWRPKHIRFAGPVDSRRAREIIAEDGRVESGHGVLLLHHREQVRPG